MCWGLYLALPASCEPVILPMGEDDSFTVWPVENPWIPLALGEEYRGWVIGSRHCSCGLVRRVTEEEVRLEEYARYCIAENARHAGQAVFAVHWVSGDFAAEELPFDTGTAVTSGQLLFQPDQTYPVDAFVWVGV